MGFLDHLFSFEGRARRREFWLIFVTALAFQVLVSEWAFSRVRPDGEPMALSYFSDTTSLWQTGRIDLALFCIALYALTLWVTSAVIVRRLHDTGRPATIYLVILGMALATEAFWWVTDATEASFDSILLLVVTLGAVCALLVFLAEIGFRGPRTSAAQYGLDPRLRNRKPAG